MPISREEVKKIAQLARLKLTPAEEKRHAETISVVLDYMKILNEVATDGVEPTAQVTGLENVARDDAFKEHTSENEEKMIENFPEKTGKLLKVRAVFDGADSADV